MATVRGGGRARVALPIAGNATTSNVRVALPSNNILMVYPRFPPTFLNFQHSLPVVGKKATLPPLGLLTIAALTPPKYDIRVVDLNCEPLTEADIAWAGMICFSAMITQHDDLFAVARRCRASGKLLVFGGPYPSAYPDRCRDYCDVLVLGEGEVTWPLFLRDLETGLCQERYESDEKADLSRSVVPRYDLIDLQSYASLGVQYSRGCPFRCEFCPVPQMFGNIRTKPTDKLLRELDHLYEMGFRGLINLIDDNIIANRKEVAAMLPELARWGEEHGNPFAYAVEASLDLAYDKKLLAQFVKANFRGVFVGIETPSIESLAETKKYQNLRKGTLIDNIRVLQEAGLVVSGGFIVGFDNDGPDIFDRQIEFIRQVAIPWVAIGLLVAIPGTPLFDRLQQEGRLHGDDFLGADGLFASTNFDTKLPTDELLRGYARILETIYAPREFFERCLESVRRLPRPRGLRERAQNLGWYLDQFASQFRTPSAKTRKVAWRSIYEAATAVASTAPALRREWLRFALRLLAQSPDHFIVGMSLAVMGVHFHKLTFETVLPEVRKRLDQEQATTIEAKAG